MKAINLVIVDNDVLYAESLSDFLSMHGLKKFYISCFTKMSGFIEYLADGENKIDILLIASSLYSDFLSLNCDIHTVICLTEGNAVLKVNSVHSINKYQNADIIVNEIIAMYAEENQGIMDFVQGEKKTKLIAVYSPSGGAGKTTIAASASVQAARSGNLVLYLNLEDIQSTKNFFSSDSNKNLSSILYHLKDTEVNLGAKIEAARCIDIENRLHYFLPPDRPTELYEITVQELEHFLFELRSLGQYDLIFVDMSSSFNSHNIKVLEACDYIFLIGLHSYTSRLKEKQFLHEIDILSKGESYCLNDKITFILNKYRAGMQIDQKEFHQKNCIKLPYCEKMDIKNTREVLSDMADSFLIGIGELVKRIM